MDKSRIKLHRRLWFKTSSISMSSRWSDCADLTQPHHTLCESSVYEPQLCLAWTCPPGTWSIVERSDYVYIRTITIVARSSDDRHPIVRMGTEKDRARTFVKRSSSNVRRRTFNERSSAIFFRSHSNVRQVIVGWSIVWWLWSIAYDRSLIVRWSSAYL